MQVILLDKISNLGSLGQLVKVKPGYGRNYLIPQGKAVLATEHNKAMFASRRAELEKTAQAAVATANERLAQLSNLVVEIKVKAGDEGKLFGSVGPRDIAVAITEKGFKVAKSEINLPNAIRLVGEYDVEVQFHTDVRGIVKVNIVPE
jgi:large subunit ribosomal protein L9